MKNLFQVSVKNYLIAMVDPDAPSRESHSCRSWLHWIVGNIKVSRILHQSVLQNFFLTSQVELLLSLKLCVCFVTYLLITVVLS